MTGTAEEGYRRECEIHEALVALYPRVKALGAYVRDLQPVAKAVPRPLGTTPVAGRDSAINALANKAANTKAAIRVLCDLGFGDEALGLGRVILELAISLEWMLKEPTTARLDTYCLFIASARKRWIDVFTKRSVIHPSLEDELARLLEDAKFAMELAGTTFADSYWAWAWFPKETLGPRSRKQRRKNPDGSELQLVTLQEMIEDRGGHWGLHEVIYFLASQYIHSAPPSILHFDECERFTLELGPNAFNARHALWTSNISMYSVLRELDSYLGASLGPDLDNVKRMIDEAGQASD